MKNKVENVDRYKNDSERDESTRGNLSLLRKEISKEMKNNELIPFDRMEDLNIEGLQTDVLESVRDYLDKIRRYNIKLYNKASDERNALVNDLQKTEESQADFYRVKRENNNEALEEFAKNSNAMERIMEYKDQLYQKMDPIYTDPTQKFIKAHFYAPRKQVFGNYISTFTANTIVIWIMTIGLYLILYFRLLKRLLDFFEELSNKLQRGE
jgi:predicted phage tail protein